jgi:hypothetical protein
MMRVMIDDVQLLRSQCHYHQIHCFLSTYLAHRNQFESHDALSTHQTTAYPRNEEVVDASPLVVVVASVPLVAVVVKMSVIRRGSCCYRTVMVTAFLVKITLRDPIPEMMMVTEMTEVMADVVSTIPCCCD